MYQLLVDYLSKADIMEGKKKVKKNVVNYLTQEGKGMPEVSLMLPLCDVLKINVNELLSGERLTEHNYHEWAEENMVKLIQEKDDKGKVIVVALVSIALVVVSFWIILTRDASMEHIILLIGVIGQILAIIWLREKSKMHSERLAAPIILSSMCDMLIAVGLAIILEIL